MGPAKDKTSKMFRDWSILNIQEINHIYWTEIYWLHILKQHLTAFVDLVNKCGLEIGYCILIFFSAKCSSHVGAHLQGSKSGKRWRSPGYPILVY